MLISHLHFNRSTKAEEYFDHNVTRGSKSPERLKADINRISTKRVPRRFWDSVTNTLHFEHDVSSDETGDTIKCKASKLQDNDWGDQFYQRVLEMIDQKNAESEEPHNQGSQGSKTQSRDKGKEPAVKRVKVEGLQTVTTSLRYVLRDGIQYSEVVAALENEQSRISKEIESIYCPITKVVEMISELTYAMLFCVYNSEGE